MADHTRKTLELLDEIEDVRAELRKLYRTPKTELGPHGPMRPATVQAQINGRESTLRQLLKLADIHSHLAIRQELQEIVNNLRPVVGL